MYECLTNTLQMYKTYYWSHNKLTQNFVFA